MTNHAKQNNKARVLMKQATMEQEEMQQAVKPQIQPDNASATIAGVKLGTIDDITADNQVLVSFSGLNNSVPARLVQSLNWPRLLDAAKNQLDLLLLFENGDASKPIIIDIVGACADDLSAVPAPILANKATYNQQYDQQSASDELQDVNIDGKHISFTAKEQISFKCGNATITLTRSGKIMLKGAYVLNRSSGSLRLKGASVQIN